MSEKSDTYSVSLKNGRRTPKPLGSAIKYLYTLRPESTKNRKPKVPFLQVTASDYLPHQNVI